MNRKLQRTCRRLAALAVLLALTAGMWGVTAAAAADKLTEGVEQAAELGLVPPELLAEDLSAPITRGEFCTLLIQASQGWGAPVVGHAPHFSDTEDEAVRACAGMGIVNGYPDGTFRPDGVLTRHQAAAMLCRAAAAFGMGGSGVLMPHTWQDEVAEWCCRDASWCYFRGIMEGTGNNCFSGERQYTRAQAIVTVLRLDRLADGAAETRTDYYPMFAASGPVQDDAQQETWQFTQLTGWLTSDGDWLTDADMLENHPAEREAALLNQRLAATPYGVPSSRLLPETFLGNPVYVQYLGFFMNQSTWFADRYGNRIEVPGVGERFWLVDLYYDAGGSLMGYFVTVEDPDIQWSYPGTTVFYNLTTGEQLEQPDEGAAPLGAESVIFCAAGDGIYAVQSRDGALTVHGAGAEPVQLGLPEGDWELTGFCQGLVAVWSRELRQMAYYTPFGSQVACVPSDG